MDEAKDGCDRTTECPLSHSHEAAESRGRSQRDKESPSQALNGQFVMRNLLGLWENSANSWRVGRGSHLFRLGCLGFALRGFLSSQEAAAAGLSSRLIFWIGEAPWHLVQMRRKSLRGLDSQQERHVGDAGIEHFCASYLRCCVPTEGWGH